MNSKEIFIHIPKTGGTTLICAVKGSKWMPKPDFNYRHIDYESKKSTCGDIFIKENFKKYQAYNIYSIIRHPVDRLISEYYFIRDRPEFMALFKKKPKNFLEYVSNPQTQNYMTSFFLGGKMFRRDKIAMKDLERVLFAIEELPIYVGIFEEYEKSLQYLSNKLKVNFPKSIDIKRVTLNRPHLDEINEKTADLILANNKLDIKLYEHCKNKIDSYEQKNNKPVVFHKNRYDYVMKYTQRFDLLELFMSNKSFLRRNVSYFRELNLALHNKIPSLEGKRYVRSWNQNVINQIKSTLPEIEEINVPIHDQEGDPLILTKELSEFIERSANTNKNFATTLLKFRAEDFYCEKRVKNKTSFIKKLFG